MVEYGYVSQAAFYTEGVLKLGVMENPGFVFFFQEKEPPYLSTVLQIDDDALAAGRAIVRNAKKTLAECLKTGRWPGYNNGEVYTASLPMWAKYEVETMLENEGEEAPEGDDLPENFGAGYE